MIYSVFISGNITSTVSSLSIFLVAAVRLLPSLNSIFSNFNTINIEKDAVSKLYNEIKQISDLPNQELNKTNDINDKDFSFDNFSKILIQNLNFSYGSKKVISDLNLEIRKGDFIGLLGKSGEGKTTLVDLILGIHKPDSGKIFVDGISIQDRIDTWRDNLAYLPQEAFLINATIEENIAIGEVIDNEKSELIRNALIKSGLSEIINSLEKKEKTVIGDRGLMLSGGQRQRLALARAFYKDKKVFIFDESTSALDGQAASRILNEITKLANEGATVILISHNNETINRCSRKIELIDGRVVEIND